MFHYHLFLKLVHLFHRKHLAELFRLNYLLLILLLLPFIAKRNTDQPMQVDLGDMSIHLCKEGVFSPYLNTALLISQADCTINYATDTAAVTPYELTQRVPSYFFGCVAILHKFAEKTYAPATDESRIAGAGAGLNDND